VDEAVIRQVLRLVGLGVRSRGAVVGVERVREAAQRGKVALALVAADSSKHSLSKVVPLLAARRVRVVSVPKAADLGHAVGREQTAVVGIVDRQLAQGIRELTDTASERSQGEGSA
jgi:ribosomal protein L7Ae-like RNA K-turn-binding protein